MKTGRKLFCIGLLVMLLILSGCAAFKVISLPKDPVVFQRGSIEGDSQNAEYMTLIWEDRVYVPYAEFTDYYGGKIGECLGYYDTGTKVPEMYVCTLLGVPGEEYVLTVNAMTHGIPTIYRELSVEGELEYESVRPYGYPFWDKKENN